MTAIRAEWQSLITLMPFLLNCGFPWSQRAWATHRADCAGWVVAAPQIKRMWWQPEGTICCWITEREHSPSISLIQEAQKALGVQRLTHSYQNSVYVTRWRYPSRCLWIISLPPLPHSLCSACFVPASRDQCLPVILSTPSHNLNSSF